MNLVGLHEPPFIDMEWVEKMPGIHNKRFAPAPLLISLRMGLVATSIMEVVEAITAREGLGRFHGMVGVEAAVKSPAFPGDTLSVEFEARIDRRTKSRPGIEESLRPGYSRLPLSSRQARDE